MNTFNSSQVALKSSNRLSFALLTTLLLSSESLSESDARNLQTSLELYGTLTQIFDCLPGNLLLA